MGIELLSDQIMGNPETGRRSLAMSPMIDEAEAHGYRAAFPIFERTNYLNSCSLGPLSRQSRAALQEYADDWGELGAPAWWLRWLPKIERIQDLFAQAIGAAPANVTIHHSISSALTSIASSIDYSSRPKVIVSEIDFPTIAYQWLVRPEVEVVFARSPDGVTIPLEEYERLLDERTAAVATSHVFYATGAIQDVAGIVELAHAKGASAVIDGYHAVGVLPVDVTALGADFYVGGTLKWVCGGPGLTFIYASPHAIERTPTVTGWFAAKEQFAFETIRFEPAETAARFQLGTPSVGPVYTGIPALELILEIGPERIYDRIRWLTSIVVDRSRDLGFSIASPHDAGKRGGIVMLRLPEPQHVVDQLALLSITVDARPGKLRIAPHFYNTEEDIEAIMDALGDIVPATLTAR
jgi:kynureninase